MTGVLLHGLLVVPLASAALALLAGRGSGAGAERRGLVVASAGGLLTLLWAGLAVAAGDATLAGNSVDVVWLSALDVHWHLGLDGVSAPLVLMSALVIACAVLSLLRSPPVGGSTVALAALLLLIEAGVMGSFLALDLVLFFVLFEVALLPMWFVIARWGDPYDEVARRRAAGRFLVFTVLGSALMLVGFAVVHAATGTFDVVALADGAGRDVPVLAAVLVGLGLAVKTPVWPLHIWLPGAHSIAPTAGSVVLAAVLLKLGTYGFVRFWLPLTDPEGLLVPVVAAFAAVGIVYAALACLAQTDLKRLIAYSSVGHMGFVVLAVTTFTTGGVQAAVMGSVAHGLVTGLLFFLAGAVKDRYGTGALADLQGLYATVPHLGGLVAFAAMASLGLPGLAGFWGEVLAIRAAVYPADVLPRGTFVVLAVLAALGVLLASAYLLALLRTMLQGATPSRPATGDPEVRDVTRAEWLVWSPLVGLTVLLGVAPGLVLTPVGRGVTAYLGGGL